MATTNRTCKPKHYYRHHSSANLEIPGERIFTKKVTYCTVCDGPLFKNKITATIGSGVPRWNQL